MMKIENQDLNILRIKRWDSDSKLYVKLRTYELNFRWIKNVFQHKINFEFKYYVCATNKINIYILQIVMEKIY